MNIKSVIVFLFIVILIAAASSSRAEIKNYKLAPETIFTEKDDDENYIFGRAYDIIADKTGAFYILDGKELCVKKFDANGKFVTKFGKPGEGPGEFWYAMKIQLLGDTIMIIQPNKLHFFNPDGTFIETYSNKNIISSMDRKYFSSKNKYVLISTDFEKEKTSLELWDETKNKNHTIVTYDTGKTVFSRQKNTMMSITTVIVFYDVDDTGDIVYARDRESRSVYIFHNGQSKEIYKVTGNPSHLSDRDLEFEKMLYQKLKQQGVDYPEKKNYSFITDVSFAGDDVMLRIRTKERTGWLRLSRAGAENAFYAEDENTAKISHTFIRNDMLYYLFNDPDTGVIVKRAKLK